MSATALAGLVVGLFGAAPAQAAPTASATAGLAAPSAPSAASVAAAGTDAANRKFPRSVANVAQTWAPLYMANDHEYSRSDALRMARQFDLIAAMPYGIKDHSTAMREVNRDLRLISYANATLGLPQDVNLLPSSAFLKDSSGNKIKANGWGTYLMRPDNVAWRTVAAEQCRSRAVLGGFDGCLMDMLTLGIFAKGQMNGTPIDPDTNQPYSQAKYRTQMINLAYDLRTRTPGLTQIGNKAENAYRYWHSDVTSRPLVHSAPGSQMEDFLRGAYDGTTDFPSAAEWQDNVRIITDMESRGLTGLFTTKLWSGASNALANQWHAYSMATFLMGANGNSFFAFTKSRDKAGASQQNLAYRMPTNLGAPTSAMTAAGNGGYARYFANGVSFVNPTNSPIRVPVAGTFTKVTGGSVSGSMQLAPRTGQVLTRSSGAATAPAKPKVKKAGKKRVSLKAGQWRKVKVVVANHGGQATAKGKVKVRGAKLKSKTKRVSSLKPGAAKTVRIKVKSKRKVNRKTRVRVVFIAGGRADKVKVPVRLRR